MKRKLRTGWRKVWVREDGRSSGDLMAICGTTILRWEYAPTGPSRDERRRFDREQQAALEDLMGSKPSPAVPCGGDTGKCPVGKGEVSLGKFLPGAKVVFKGDPTRTLVVLESEGNGPSRLYSLDNGATLSAESDLALPPKYPVGTWGGTAGNTDSWPIGEIVWHCVGNQWQYCDEGHRWFAVERGFEVRPPDPAYRWPKGCGPLPRTRVRVVDHPADFGGLVNNNSDTERAGKTFVVASVGQVKVLPALQTCDGAWLWLHNCFPAEGVA